MNIWVLLYDAIRASKVSLGELFFKARAPITSFIDGLKLFNDIFDAYDVCAFIVIEGMRCLIKENTNDEREADARKKLDNFHKLRQPF